MLVDAVTRFFHGPTTRVLLAQRRSEKMRPSPVIAPATDIQTSKKDVANEAPTPHHTTITKPISGLARITQYYHTTALLLLNTIVLLIILNVIMGIAFLFKDRMVFRKDKVTAIKADIDPESQGLFYTNGKPFDNGKRTSYQLEWFDYTAYERVVDATYVGNVLDDFFNLSKLGFIYQPWIQFSESPYHGKLVNVDIDSKGFPHRRTLSPQNGQLATMLIFVLGGSTTFGYNVADEQTWPSYLSKILNERVSTASIPIQVKVMNYGRAFYDTSQETVLLIALLKSGLRPNLVIFMDGLNWGLKQDVPYFTSKFGKVFSDLQSPSLSHLAWVPMIRLSFALKDRLLSRSSDDKFKMNSKDSQDENNYVKYIMNRFIQNRMIAIKICEQYSVKSLFFLQPDPIYNYPINLYRPSLADQVLKDRPTRQQFYARMRTTEGIIDLTNLFELWGDNRKVIVDDVHYSPGFNRFLAQQVAKYIDVESLMTESQDTDTPQSTGAPSRW